MKDPVRPQLLIVDKPEGYLVRWALKRWRTYTRFAWFKRKWFEIHGFKVGVFRDKIIIMGGCPSVIHGLAAPYGFNQLLARGPLDDTLPVDAENQTNIEYCCAGALITGCVPLISDCQFNRVYPATHAVEIGNSREWRLSSKLKANYTAWLDGTLPGRYSGEMRKVVQDLLGRGQTIPWSYSNNITHGIYTAADNSKWVIQISGSGVHATRLGICGENTKTERLLDYIPRAATFPTLSDESVIELADATAMGNAYSNPPLFPECGWAFSASGALAANVFWGEESQGMSSYVYTRRYEITISETDNKPSGAIVTEAASGYVWGPDDNVKLKHPDYALSVLVSHELDNDNPAAPTATTAPIHVWYDGETRQDVIFHWDPGTAISDTAGNNNWSGHENRQMGYSSPALAAPPLISWITGVEEVVTDLGVVLGHQRTALRLQEIAARRKDITTYTTGKGTVMVDVLGIPFNDRESIYHSRQRSDIDEGTFDRRIRWVHGHWYGDNTGSVSSTAGYIAPNDDAYRDQHPDFVDCSSGNPETVQCSQIAFDRIAAGLDRWSVDEQTSATIDVWDMTAIDAGIAYGGNIQGCGSGFKMDYYGATPEAVFQQLLPETATLRHTGKEVSQVIFNLCPQNAYRLCYETSPDGGATWDPEICTDSYRAWPARAYWVTNMQTLHRDDYGHGTVGPIGSTVVSREAGAVLTGTAVPITLSDPQWTAMSADNYPPSPANQLLNVVADANGQLQSIYSTALDTTGWVTRASSGDYPIVDDIDIHSAFVGKP